MLLWFYAKSNQTKLTLILWRSLVERAATECVFNCLSKDILRVGRGGGNSVLGKESGCGLLVQPVLGEIREKNLKSNKHVYYYYTVHIMRSHTPKGLAIL